MDLVQELDELEQLLRISHERLILAPAERFDEILEMLEDVIYDS